MEFAFLSLSGDGVFEKAEGGVATLDWVGTHSVPDALDLMRVALEHVHYGHLILKVKVATVLSIRNVRQKFNLRVRICVIQLLFTASLTRHLIFYSLEHVPLLFIHRICVLAEAIL